MNAILGGSFTNAILPKTGIAKIVSELNDKIATVQECDMTSIEAMLVGQAHAADHKVTSTHAPAHAPAKEINNKPNELLEVNNGSKTMDDRTSQTSTPRDSAMATVAT